MPIEDVIKKIDAEIAKLQQARTLLAEHTVKSTAASQPTGKKRSLSVSARKRIADAQKKRWAAVKAAKSSPKRTLKKKLAVKPVNAVAKPGKATKPVTEAAQS
jgi:hypothetical protein